MKQTKIEFHASPGSRNAGAGTWRSTARRRQGARAYEHNAEFSPVLANAMGFYGAGAGQRGDTISRVRGEIAEVKHVMIENIDKVGGGEAPAWDGIQGSYEVAEVKRAMIENIEKVGGGEAPAWGGFQGRMQRSSAPRLRTLKRVGPHVKTGGAWRPRGHCQGQACQDQEH